MQAFAATLIGSLLLLTACQQPVTYSPKVMDAELQQEELFQQRLIDEAKARGGNPKRWDQDARGVRKQFARVGGRIEKAGADLCRELGLPQQERSCYYYFQLSSGKEINASADGENVTISMGMMRFIEGDDELAGVMGHELAHNFMDHLGKNRTNALMGALVGALVDGALATQGGTGSEFSRFGAQMGASSYSPDFESEADYIGLYIMARAGYNVKKMPGFWRRLSVEEPGTASGGMSHPSNPKRFVMLQKTIDEITYKRKNKLPLVPEFKPQT